jgi:hypothetical protein
MNFRLHRQPSFVHIPTFNSWDVRSSHHTHTSHRENREVETTGITSVLAIRRHRVVVSTRRQLQQVQLAALAV